MSVPHYGYLKLKMPGPKGVDIITGSFIRSDRCDREFHKIYETFGTQEELAELALTTDNDLLKENRRSELT